MNEDTEKIQATLPTEWWNVREHDRKIYISRKQRALLTDLLKEASRSGDRVALKGAPSLHMKSWDDGWPTEFCVYVMRQKISVRVQAQLDSDKCETHRLTLSVHGDSSGETVRMIERKKQIDVGEAYVRIRRLVIAEREAYDRNKQMRNARARADKRNARMRESLEKRVTSLCGRSPQRRVRNVVGGPQNLHFDVYWLSPEAMTELVALIGDDAEVKCSLGVKLTAEQARRLQARLDALDKASDATEVADAFSLPATGS